MRALQAFRTAANGPLTGQDLQSLASVLKLNALHLENIKIDSFTEIFERSLDPAQKIDLYTHPLLKKHFSLLKSYVPTFTMKEMVGGNSLTPADVAAARTSLHEHGLVWHYHQVADGLRQVAKSLPASQDAISSVVNVNFEKSSQRNVVLRDGVYHLGSPARIEDASFIGLCIYVVCNILLGEVFTGAISVLKSTWDYYSYVAICASDALASFALDIVTEGDATVLSDVEGEVCAEAEEYAEAQDPASPSSFVFTQATLVTVLTSVLNYEYKFFDCPGH